MRTRHTFALLCMGIAMNVWADNMILDFDSIERIELNLKPNQTLMIDHKSGALLGIMEISPNGVIKRLPIPPDLLGKSEADIMGGSSLKEYEVHTDRFVDSPTTIYYKEIEGEAKIPMGNEKGVENPKLGIKQRKGEREWDKSKIIYEQAEEILDIIR
ncbi:hypothetical protein [uncultured Helicobacter sp.]|uniref:hypothetical protein n=2 Tax=uncultured Helicobacter sp. TaxID=175537 RepID=UPI0025FEF321|nr:hypothetical protein [uncultured Helicobacter sp.]